MKSYISGFIISLILTLTAFALVSQHVNSEHQALPHNILIPAIIVLAIVQLITQLVLFLHLGRENKPRFNLTIFLFMLLVVGLLVGGSLWIMANLDYHGMHDKNVDEYIIHDEGVHTH